MSREEMSEPLVWAGHPSWGQYFLLWIISVAVGIHGVSALWSADWKGVLISFFGAWVLAFLAVSLRRMTRYTVSRQSVSLAFGFQGCSEKIIPMKQIASASIQQGPLDRLLGIGAVVLYMKEGERRCERLRGVKDPNWVCQKIAAML